MNASKTRNRKRLHIFLIVICVSLLSGSLYVMKYCYQAARKPAGPIEDLNNKMINHLTKSPITPLIDAAITNMTKSSSSTVEITTPVTGRLTRVYVSVGDLVVEGQLVATIESMKMEIAIIAPRGGRIEAILQTTGTIIDANTVIVNLHQ